MFVSKNVSILPIERSWTLRGSDWPAAIRPTLCISVVPFQKGEDKDTHRVHERERERISFSFPFSFSPRAFDFVCASVSLFCSFPPIPDPMAIVEYHVEERQHRRRLGVCVTSRPYQSTFNSFSSPIEKGKKNHPQRPPSFIAKAFSESNGRFNAAEFFA